jgi:hypothetical protein
VQLWEMHGIKSHEINIISLGWIVTWKEPYHHGPLYLGNYLRSIKNIINIMLNLCLILCICNIALSVLGVWVCSHEKITSTLCSLTILHLLFSLQKERVGGELPPESFQAVLLRKQIQAMNWRLLSNKATYLTMLRERIRRREPTTFHRCHSDKPPTSRKCTISKLWKSSSELSNFNSISPT